MQSNAIANMVSIVTQENDYLTRKLAHYNAWLGDTKRPLTSKYPGFPEPRPGEGPAKTAKPKRKKLTVAEQIEFDQAFPVSYKKVQAKAEAKVEKKATKSKPVKSAGSATGSSKQNRAAVLFKEFNGDRKQTIQAIMEQLNMSTAGATTYFYNAKKLAG